MTSSGCTTYRGTGTYFVVRAKRNNDFRPVRWARRFQPGAGILSDAVGYIDGQLTMEKYSDRIRRVKYRDEDANGSSSSSRARWISVR